MTDQQWTWEPEPVYHFDPYRPHKLREVGTQRPLTPVGKRAGAAGLELVLRICTLWVGWFIWSLIAWNNGQTPAMQLLGMRVVEGYDGRVADWGTMLLRQSVGKKLCLVVGVLSLGALFFMPVWDRYRQAMWDKLAGTYVVDA